MYVGKKENDIIYKTDDEQNDDLPVGLSAVLAEQRTRAMDAALEA
jgi:hypothetical protein